MTAKRRAKPCKVFELPCVSWRERNRGKVHEMRRALIVLSTGVLLGVPLPVSSAAGAPTCFGEPATIIGTSGRDSLVGTDGDDVIVGRGGRDYLEGKDGDDIICGGSGGRSGGDEPEWLVGGAGDDVLLGQAGLDELLGGSGRDRISGGGGPDFAYGQRGADRLFGGPEQDHLYGHDGHDVMRGHRGYDILGLDAGNDVIIGGNDGLLGDSVHSLSAPGPLRVDLSRGVARGWGRDRLVGVEGVSVGSEGSYSDIIIGDSGDNDLGGGGGAGVVRAKGGNDCVGGSEGDDELDGGPGFDMFTTFYCEAGEGSLSPFPGRSEGGLFIDLEEGRALDEVTGEDALVGFEGAFGTVNQDEMWGNDRANYLFGDEGNDDLYGRGGDDELHGSAGTDSADGGDGTDSCVEIEVPVSCE